MAPPAKGCAFPLPKKLVQTSDSSEHPGKAADTLGRRFSFWAGRCGDIVADMPIGIAAGLPRGT